MTAEAGATVMVWLALSETEPLLTRRVTEYGPVVAKEWTGFREALVPPSPKFQDQEVGLPVVVSVN